MIEKVSTACFSGHRSERLPQTSDGIDHLRIRLYEEIDKTVTDGLCTFLFGGCYGFDLICAETVLIHKRVIASQNDTKIKLIAVLPFEGQANRWSISDRDAYFRILERCDKVITLSKRYTSDSYYERNQYMVDNSSKLICYYDGKRGGTEYTIKYAKKAGLEIVNTYQA